MVSINYTRLFNLGITHTYYENNRARGIKVQPTRETSRLLQGGNMLFKTIPSGMVILYRAQNDEVSPFVELPPDQKFTFTLRAENKAEFQNITNLDVSTDDRYSASSILYFTNDPAASSADPENPEVISHQLLDGLKNSLFTYSFGIDSPPSEVLLRVRNAEEELVSVGKTEDGTALPLTLTLTRNNDDNYAQQIDLRNKVPGRYTFTIRNTADDETLKEEVFYMDDELASGDLLGIVDITYDTATGHLYGNTEEYELQFTRKESIWAYFIVNKNRNIVFDDDDLFIDDQGSEGYTPINFTRDGDEPHATIRVNGLDTVVFKSDDPIPFFELPKASVQLRKNPGNSVLVNNLPNPSHSGLVKVKDDTIESEIYVFI